MPEPAFSDVDEHDLALPLPADGSQKKAIRWATAGRTFVLEGPPGTGKSQTIANLVADAIARGEKVLFVAEKEAALDVVARRLRQVGLGDLCLDLHSKEQTVRSVRTHLKQAVRRRPLIPGDAFGALKARQKMLVEALAAHPRGLREADDDVVDVVVDARRRRVQEYRDTGEHMRSLLMDELRDRVARRIADFGDDVGGALSRLRRDLSTAHTAEIRELVAEHIDAILSVTPCLLMTSASVAQYLPARPGLVDIVVFDEASQIRVASAIGAMGRASSVVIVGDEKQMPPTDVFTTTALVEDDDASEEESILLEAHRVRLPRLPLTWHYRSRSEGLVGFSNERYYEGALATFPTPPGAASECGVELRRLYGQFSEGRRKKKLNHVEASAVVDEVRRRLEADPDASIGVVTFNNNQRDHLLDKLESCDDPEVQAALARPVEPLFVKNLENVQGDERDVILFSLTYSVGDGRRPTNFGLLSRPGGERRLNVAVTRARERNILFCSFDASDITGASAHSNGLAHLRDYMLAAERGTLPGGPEAPGDGARADAYRAEMAAELREHGLEVLEDVGSSTFRVDLAVRAEGRPWIAVQLDTLEWATRPSVGDRDELPYAVLVDGMGWATHLQVYRAEWRNDPQGVVRRIAELAECAAITPRPETAAVVAEDPTAPDPVGIAEAQADDVRRVAETVTPLAAAQIPDAGVGVEMTHFVAASEKLIADDEERKKLVRLPSHDAGKAALPT